MMKRSVLFLLAAFLVLSSVVCLTGCAKRSSATTLKEKVVAMIDCDVAQDTEGAYALLYPGVMDFETYRTTAEQIYEYFPVTAGYTCQMQAWNATNTIGAHAAKTYEGRYKVEFDEKTFYILVTWRSDKNGSGFTGFQILNEADWLASQK